MSSLREQAERDRITVKIRNMNRSASRDSPPPSTHSSSRGTKRSASGTMGRYDGGGGGNSSDERMTPDRMRRRVRSPSPRPRYGSPHRDDYGRMGGRSDVPGSERGGNGGAGHSYKVLCVSALHHKASDEFIKETLYREFKRFGDFSIRIAHDMDERVAYVCFRTTEDARDAKHAKPRVMLYDKPAIVEPVIETARPPHGGGGGGLNDYNKYKARSRSPVDYDRVYYAPPPPSDRRGGGGGGGRGPPLGVDPYYGGPPPPSVSAMHHHHAVAAAARGTADFRPVMHHHHSAPHHSEYMAPRGPPMHHGHAGGGGLATIPPPLAAHHHASHHAHHLAALGGGGGVLSHHGHPGAHVSGVQPPLPLSHHHYGGGGGGGGGGVSGGGAGGGAPRHGGGSMMQRPGGGSGPHENKKDKFPNYLHHVQPEDDPMATRTLFAGNLEINISEEELRRIFGKYGVCEDIDIKRPPPGTGNAFAFVRFQNLDMAHRAKVELSGQYIGKFQCKIGYGKSTPSAKIWIGGLGAWTSITQLEREFDRYGAIKKVDYQKGDTSAHVTYETIEAATAAVKEMRGFELGGPDRRLRIDYVDNNGAAVVKPKLGPPGYEAGPSVGGGEPGGVLGAGPGGEYGGHRSVPGMGGEYGGGGGDYPGGELGGYGGGDAYGRGGAGYRGRGPAGGAAAPSAYRGARGGPPTAAPGVGGYAGGGGRGYGAGGEPGGRDDDWRRPPADLEYEPNHRATSRRSGSREPGVDRSRSRSHHRARSPADSDSDSSSFRRTGGGNGAGPNANSGSGSGSATGGGANATGAASATGGGSAAGGGQLSAARTLPDVARKCTKLWTGALILKSSLFPAKFHMTDGDPDIVDGLMRDEDGKHHLRITQRLRLDQPKLEDVQKRIQSSAAHAIFLGLAGSTSSVHIDDASVQTRPLRNLVSYLKQKEAAGVISLLNKETEATGVLYAFPPCDFSAELLKKTCAAVSEEALKEDHLVIVVVRGGTA